MGRPTADFLDTGIEELNALLTRNKEAGIALPKIEGTASSAIVIKGEIGTGKSVLASILASNLHYRKSNGFLLFSVYFSFTQPSSGLYNYINDILDRPPPTKPNSNKDTSQNSIKSSPPRPYPLIVSPKTARRISETDGVAVLHRCLVDNLALLRTPPFASASASQEGDIWKRLREYTENFNRSGEWVIGAKVEDIAPEYLMTSNLSQKADQPVRILPVVFVDPINFFFDYRDSRMTISELFATFRVLKWPLIATLEDVEIAANEPYCQLASYVEFESDAVLELAIRATPYVRRTIEVKKSRNSQPIYGPQAYRIDSRKHSLSNIPSSWQGEKHPGFLIFRSIHWYLSRSRKRYSSEERYYSGMHHFDDILTVGMEPGMEPPLALPPDAFILVRGKKGGHKLSVAFNLLVAGLWDVRRKEEDIKESESTMLLSLGEETSIDVSNIALAWSGTGANTKDNANNIQKIERTKDSLSRDKDEAQEVGEKVIINEWFWKPLDAEVKLTKLIEVTFKPGYLSPEEFLWVVESLAEEYQPSRLLVENTAHLRMRFPELHKETMLFPALSSLTHSKQIMLIVTDVLGDGSDEELSYGLAACADYIVHLEQIQEIKEYADTLEKGMPGRTYRKEQTWFRMLVSNIRGKNYFRVPYAVTVSLRNDQNTLFLVKLGPSMSDNASTNTET